MPRGDTQREFAAAAARDGIVLTGQSVDWLCQRGHLGLPHEAGSARAALERIYVALGGDLDVLASAKATRLTGGEGGAAKLTARAHRGSQRRRFSDAGSLPL